MIILNIYINYKTWYRCHLKIPEWTNERPGSKGCHKPHLNLPYWSDLTLQSSSLYYDFEFCRAGETEDQGENDQSEMDQRKWQVKAAPGIFHALDVPSIIPDSNWEETRHKSQREIFAGALQGWPVAGAITARCYRRCPGFEPAPTWYLNVWGRQTRDVDPMLGKCWILDGGITALLSWRTASRRREGSGGKIAR